MMFFLPLSLVLDNIFLGIMFLSIVFNLKKLTKSRVFYYLLFLLLFTVLNSILNNCFFIESENILRLLPLILIPFCLGNIEKNTRRKGLVFLSFAIVIIQLNAIYGIINYYYFTEGKKYALKNYSKINEILNYERPYLGFFSAINVTLSYYYFKLKNKRRWLNISLAIFSLVLIVIISARLAITIVFFTSLVVILVKLNKKYILKTTLLFIGVIFLIFCSNSSLRERFKQISKDARVVTWKGASVIFLKNSKYIFGSGSEQDTRVNLLEYYRNYDGFDSAAEQNRFINKNYNTHNQYINELLRGGFVGLLLLIIPQAILLYKSVSKKNVLSFMFLVSIMSFSFVENILARQIGVYLFALLLSLSSISYKERE
jgi:hypothetical protein